MSDRPAGRPNAAEKALWNRLGYLITLHCRFEWQEAVPPASCGAGGWEAGPGTRIDLEAIVTGLREAGLIVVSVPGEGENPRVVLHDGTVALLRPAESHDSWNGAQLHVVIPLPRISGTEQAT